MKKSTIQNFIQFHVTRHKGIKIYLVTLTVYNSAYNSFELKKSVKKCPNIFKNYFLLNVMQ
jgi:hypothetical protein